MPEAVEMFGVDIEPFYSMQLGQDYVGTRDTCVTLFEKKRAEIEKGAKVERGVLERLQQYRQSLAQLRSGAAAIGKINSDKVGDQFVVDEIAFEVEAMMPDTEVVALTEGIEGWIEDGKESLDELDRMLTAAVGNADKLAREYALHAKAFESGATFFNCYMNTLLSEYVFVKADMKFKTKACKQLIRFATAGIEAARVFKAQNDLHRYTDEKTSQELSERIRTISETMMSQLGCYKLIRQIASEEGIEAAFLKWKNTMRDCDYLKEFTSSQERQQR